MSGAKHHILCLASYFKGNRFLQRAKREGSHVVLLTVERMLKEPWARESLDEVFAVPSFENRRALINTVAYLFRTRPFDRLVALDDYDVEVAAALREHFRLPGFGDTVGRFFRDKLAMRTKARACGIVIPDFTPLFHDGDVRRFTARVPPPWLLKPRAEASAIGIKKLTDEASVFRALDELGDDRSTYLLEQMVPGTLYHVDSIVAGNRVAFAQASRYERPLLDVYHGGGIFMSRTLSAADPAVPALLQANRQVLEGFELGAGASHTEFMVAHADGQPYFIETSARVGGANIADMVEAATGLNLWEEWAKVELDRGLPYDVPTLKTDHAGVIVSLARQEHPDDSVFADPEIWYRLTKKNHIGFVLRSPSAERLDQLLREYQDRIHRDYHAVLPAATKATD